jgi:[acyl-carrier-protein] S-malonyltransferase
MTHVGFLFPGQGSQSIGMLKDLYENHSLVREVMQEASSTLDYDLWEIISNGPLDKLNATEFTQPAMLAADIAIWKLWCAQSTVRPVVIAGHSLGEFAALVAAGVISFSAALKLVSLRGKYMQAAVEPGVGAMAAVLGVDNAQVSALCDEVREHQVLSPANFNSHGQVVIAGHRDAVIRAVDKAADFGARLAKIIPVSVPSHCQLIAPAVEPFTQAIRAINEWSMPSIPIIHNAEVRSADSIDEIQQLLVQQLTHPVRWVETIESMAASGVSCFVESGPGLVLKGLNKRIVRAIPTYSLLNEPAFQESLKAIGDL